MKEFLVTVDCDYVVGHLRHGHLQGIVRAETLEEAKEKSISFSDLDLVIDDYEVDGYSVGDNPVEVIEMNYE